jgi:hypothetical protein
MDFGSACNRFSYRCSKLRACEPEHSLYACACCLAKAEASSQSYRLCNVLENRLPAELQLDDVDVFSKSAVFNPFGDTDKVTE